MRGRYLVVCSLVALFALPGLQAGHAGPGTHYGDGNFPEGCSGDFGDDCYHMRVGLNSLDTPVIDVLLVTPASPFPERDVRIMRQAIEMWDAGIHYLAADMDMDWLVDGVEFNIFLDDDEFTTHPLWDPEIVVVTSNPVGGAGIGIDPIGFRGPCKGANPLAGFEAWEALPGFDSHHDGHSGTYIESCEGGGTTCYAVNGAIDPAPGVFSFFGLFNLVAHEVGHCLSVGHVGDALDFSTNVVPYDDIMAYADTGRAKCVSTLDVESFAVRMSRYLLAQPLRANDGNYHTQHPVDHYYASQTGAPEQCKEPDDGVVPGEPTDFWPGGFYTVLNGPSEVENGIAATYTASAGNAAGNVTCTITAEGDALRANESSDGCSVDLGWTTDGAYRVSVVATDGVDEAGSSVTVYVSTPGQPRDIVKTYTAPTFSHISADLLGCDDTTNIGGVCFEVRPGETELSVVVTDDVFATVPFSVHYHYGPGWAGTAGFHCSRADGLVLPPDTTDVRIELEVLMPRCLTTDAPTVAGASTGTIVARLS